MNDHSPSTDSCSSAGRAPGPARRCRPTVARGCPRPRGPRPGRWAASSPGPARGGPARPAPAARRRPRMVSPSISPSIRVLTNPTPRITTSLNQASRNRAPVRSTSSKSASLRWTWWNLARCRWTCSNRESARSCWWNSAMPATLPTASDSIDILGTWGASHRRPRSTSTAGTPTRWPPRSRTRSSSATSACRRICFHQPARLGRHRRGVDALRLSPGDTLLDLACGRGGYGLEIAGRTGTRLVGVDFSAERCGRRRSRPSGSVGRPTSAPPRHLYPLVAVLSSTRSSSPSSPLLRTGSRVLVPGGRAVLTCWEPVDPADTGLPERLRKVHLRCGLTQARREPRVAAPTPDAPQTWCVGVQRILFFADCCLDSS